MIKTMTFKKPKWTRRIASGLFDFICVVVIALLLSFVVTPICNTFYNANEVYDQYYQYVIDTHLYTRTENGVSIIYDITVVDNNLQYFYENCTENQEEFTEYKKNSEYFILDSDTNLYKVKDGIERVQLQTFYDEIVNHCIQTYLDNYLKKQDGYLKASNTIAALNYTILLFSSLFSLLLVYLLIPLIRKDGKTIGKILLHLNIVSKMGNFTPTKLQIAFRGLITIFFEYLVSIYTISIFGMFIPLTLLISLICTIFTKFNQSFHDLCCSTFLVDDYVGNEPLDIGDSYQLKYDDMKKESQNGK